MSIVFAGDDLAVFETIISLLTLWQRNFLCTFPLPPIPLLSAIESALRLHDPELVRHLISISAGPQDYCWPLLRSAFTEVCESLSHGFHHHL